ncbi:acetylcholinesterase 1-like [Contarinia nasturtii]|uniref:acetylcholinesterase 1-like n=1 Tax=Contarinia nasturtii TaxID=265458 RepID=UPI0012D48C29|nr:acetylcholinesterase 1-like [Contarinia nasturtii]
MLQNIDFYAFKGIPYAQPPIGELRFKAPEPIESWPNVLDAFEHSDSCLGQTFLSFGHKKSENCLYLNVYVPSATAKPDNKLAVMFWIHGGGFLELSGDESYFGPDFLIEQNVILVTINYRLGALGFLSLDTPDYSGNMGLKDQQLALKWIHENIEYFYGDNKRITVFGESAGGVSTHFHVLSSESRKYFHNAIIMSGTAQSPWALSNEKNHISVANHIAEELGNTTNSMDELIDFLKSAPADKLASYIYLDDFIAINRFKFAPVIERKDAKNPFMVEPAHKIYRTSNINRDAIFYHTSHEAQAFLVIYQRFINDWEPTINFTISMPSDDFNFPVNSSEYSRITKLVRKFYFGNELINEETLSQLTEMKSDISFIYPNYKTMDFHRQKANTYYIRFSVNSTLNLFKRQLNIMDIPGASHSDELCYIFRNHFCDRFLNDSLKNVENKESEIDLRTIAYITKLFSNFAKYGEPTHKNNLIPGYRPIKSGEFNFLDITNDGLKLGVNPRQRVMDFWHRTEVQAQRLMIEANKQNETSN